MAQTQKKPTLWERTKEVAATYTGTFIVVMVLNQLLFFGFCLNPICIIAAMPHVLFITVVVGSFFNKVNNWGNRRLVKKTNQSIGSTFEKLGEAFESAGKAANQKAQAEYNRLNAEMDAVSIEQKKQLAELRETVEAKRQPRIALEDDWKEKKPCTKKEHAKPGPSIARTIGEGIDLFYENEKVGTFKLSGSASKFWPDITLKRVEKRQKELTIIKSPPDLKGIVNAKVFMEAKNGGLKLIGFAENIDVGFIGIWKKGLVSFSLDLNPVSKYSANTRQSNIEKSGDQEVFITSSNLYRLTSAIDMRTIPSYDYRELYKTDLRSILSTKELDLLFVHKKICEDPELVFEVYDKISPRNNSYMVFQGGSPSYHLRVDCKALHRDYFNIEMPPEIEARGPKEIEKFREYCKENRDLIQREDRRVFVKMEAQFFLKNPINTVSAGNTGVESFINLDLNELSESIDQLLQEAERFRNKDDNTFKMIKDKGYGTHQAREARDPGNPLYIWKNTYKEPLKRSLKSYFRVKFNSDLSFEGHLLDQLGFKPCHQCFEKIVRKSI